MKSSIYLILGLIIFSGLVSCGKNPLAPKTKSNANIELIAFFPETSIATKATVATPSDIHKMKYWIYSISDFGTYENLNLPESEQLLAHDSLNIVDGKISGKINVAPGLLRLDFTFENEDDIVLFFAGQEVLAHAGANRLEIEAHSLALSDITLFPDSNGNLKIEDRLEMRWSDVALPGSLGVGYRLDYGIGDSPEMAYEYTNITIGRNLLFQAPPVSADDQGKTFLRLWTHFVYGSGPISMVEGPEIVTDASFDIILNF